MGRRGVDKLRQNAQSVGRRLLKVEFSVHRENAAVGVHAEDTLFIAAEQLKSKGGNSFAGRTGGSPCQVLNLRALFLRFADFHLKDGGLKGRGAEAVAH